VASRSSERGEGRIGLLISLVILGVGIFVGVKIIPVRIDAYEFGDFIEQECRYAAVRNQGGGDVTKRILDKAVELDIPLKKKDLVVQRTANEMIITASYELPIDLKVTVYNYRYYRREKAPIF
jgi:type III secretion system FlhB-like substrate exporter